MIKLTITKIGEPKDVQTRYGKKQKSWIMAKEYGENFLSYWVNGYSKDWGVGKEVEVERVDERDYQGKKYYDVIIPRLDREANSARITQLLSELNTRTGLINNKIDRIIDHLSGKDKFGHTSDGNPVPFNDTDNI